MSQLTPDPFVTPPVSIGPVSVFTIGGIPVVRFTGQISHYTGNKLASLVMDAASRSGATINIDEAIG